MLFRKLTSLLCDPKRGRKKILIQRLNWAGLNEALLAQIAGERGPVFVNFPGDHKDRPISVQVDSSNYREIRYRGISLYQVSIYSVCVETGTYIRNLSSKTPEHWSALAKWYAHSAGTVDLAHAYFDQHDFQQAVIFQGYFHDSAIVRAVAHMRGVPVVALEITSNKNKLLWDNIAGITVNKNLARNYYWKYEDLIDPSVATEYVEQAMLNIRSVKRLDHQAPERVFTKRSSRPLIFVVGQVYTDASLLFGLAPGFQNPIDVIRVAVDYALANDVELVIKLHPKEINEGDPITFSPYNKLTWRRMCEDQALMDKITFSDLITVDHDNAYDTYSIIAAADVVVTVNSQAGLEALAKGKPVVLCGSSFYGGLGLTYEAQNPDALRLYLRTALSDSGLQADKAAVDKFFYIYFEKYCIEKTEAALYKLILGNLGNRSRA